jgi:hypothetical protein
MWYVKKTILFSFVSIRQVASNWIRKIRDICASRQSWKSWWKKQWIFTLSKSIPDNHNKICIPLRHIVVSVYNLINIDKKKHLPLR